jgi:hypothetical protein
MDARSFGSVGVCAILQGLYTGLPSAEGAAIEVAIGFHTMPDDATSAMATDRRQHVYSTLETVEAVLFAVHDHDEGFVVVISTMCAAWHGALVFEILCERPQASCPSPRSEMDRIRT